MLKHSIQIELFLILWVPKLIYSESPMYTVLDKDTIKNEILPHLSKAKRGYVTQSREFDTLQSRVDGLFLNADAGFDCDALRGFLCEKEIIANICINKRRENADDIFVDDELYAERYSIERTNAWMDSFRTLLNRFDTTVANWTSWNYLAFAVLLLKKISRKQKV